MKLDYDTIKSVVLSKNYRFFEGELNINRIGIRTNNRKANNYDDVFALLWQENGENKIYIDKDFTTDPGIYYLQKEFMNPDGCAILKPGQYRKMHVIGIHRGKYEAFVQNAPCVLYRDRNKDNILDFNADSITTGVFGINQHHGYDTQYVNNNSAGCQVHRYKSRLKEVLSIAKKSAKIYGNSFTYTLIEEKDF